MGPRISLNNAGFAVEVHQSESTDTLWYHVVKLTGCASTFSSSVKYDSGINPSVALNDAGTVLEVHESDGLSTNMWYHVGKLDSGRMTVDWGGSHKYDTGKAPSVALNNSHVAVEVHPSDGLSSNMWYHVGTVDPAGKIVNWGSSHKYDTGATPSIAINNHNVVVEVHQSDGPSTALWYHVGTVDPSAKTINWGSSVEYDNGDFPRVALTDDGYVIEVHQSQTFQTLWWRIGVVDVGAKRINWLMASARQYDTGMAPAVATNGRQVIAVQQNLARELCSSATLLMDRSRWMSDALPAIGASTLKQLVMPGSHDAGMSVVSGCTGALNFGANACNTQTQTLSIGDQLAAGSRYFDIRPVLQGGTFVTGHFNTSPFLGCNGQGLTQVLDEAKNFVRSAPDMAILKFSHYIDRDTGGGFNDSQMEQLISLVIARLGDALYKGPATLGSTTLSQYLGSTGRIVVVFDGLSSLRSKYVAQGIYSYSDYSGQADLTVYDQYAKTNTLPTMINDQLGRMNNPANHGGDMFLLSWTLTQSDPQAIACGANVGLTSILDLAYEANAALWPSLAQHSISPTALPNVVYVDNNRGQAADFSVWLLETVRS
jgi:hypothetical protein